MSVELTPQELKLIEAALQTQEKILTLQSHAGSDKSTKLRLSEIKDMIARLRERSAAARPGNWSQKAMAYFL